MPINDFFSTLTEEQCQTFNEWFKRWSGNPHLEEFNTYLRQSFFKDNNLFDRETNRLTQQAVNDIVSQLTQTQLSLDVQLIAGICFLVSMADDIVKVMILVGFIEVTDLKELMILKERLLEKLGLEIPQNAMLPFLEIVTIEEHLNEYLNLAKIPAELLEFLERKYRDYLTNMRESFFTQFSFLFHVMLLRVGLARGQIGTAQATEYDAGIQAKIGASRFREALPFVKEQPDFDTIKKMGFNQIIPNLENFATSCAYQNGDKVEKILTKPANRNALYAIRLSSIPRKRIEKAITIISNNIGEFIDYFQKVQTQIQTRQITQLDNKTKEYISQFLQEIKKENKDKDPGKALHNILFEETVVESIIIAEIYEQIKNEFEIWIISANTFSLLLNIFSSISAKEMSQWFVNNIEVKGKISFSTFVYLVVKMRDNALGRKFYNNFKDKTKSILDAENALISHLRLLCDDFIPLEEHQYVLVINSLLEDIAREIRRGQSQFLASEEITPHGKVIIFKCLLEDNDFFFEALQYYNQIQERNDLRAYIIDKEDEINQKLCKRNLNASRGELAEILAFCEDLVLSSHSFKENFYVNALHISEMSQAPEYLIDFKVTCLNKLESCQYSFKIEDFLSKRTPYIVLILANLNEETFKRNLAFCLDIWMTHNNNGTIRPNEKAVFSKKLLAVCAKIEVSEVFNATVNQFNSSMNCLLEYLPENQLKKLLFAIDLKTLFECVDNQNRTPISIILQTPAYLRVYQIIAEKLAREDPEIAAMYVYKTNKEMSVHDFPGLKFTYHDGKGNGILYYVGLNQDYAMTKRIFLKNPYEMKHQNNEGDTPLHIIFYSGQNVVINWAIENDAVHFIKNKKGETPLSKLAENKEIQLTSQNIKKIIERECLNLIDKDLVFLLGQAKDDISLMDKIVSHSSFNVYTYLTYYDEMVSDHNAELSIILSKVISNKGAFELINQIARRLSDFNFVSCSTIDRLVTEYPNFYEEKSAVTCWALFCRHPEFTIFHPISIHKMTFFDYVSEKYPDFFSRVVSESECYQILNNRWKFHGKKSNYLSDMKNCFTRKYNNSYIGPHENEVVIEFLTCLILDRNNFCRKPKNDRYLLFNFSTAKQGYTKEYFEMLNFFACLENNPKINTLALTEIERAKKICSWRATRTEKCDQETSLRGKKTFSFK